MSEICLVMSEIWLWKGKVYNDRRRTPDDGRWMDAIPVTIDHTGELKRTKKKIQDGCLVAKLDFPSF